MTPATNAKTSTDSVSPAHAAAAAANQTMRAVTLRLEDETFAIEAESVREILDLTSITKVPNASPFVSGLINVRGSVVPLADFRVMFGMEQRENSRDTRIVVVEVEVDGEAMVAGLLADMVHDVTDISKSAIGAPPSVGMRWPPHFVRGIGQHDDKFIVIPDMTAIFSSKGGV